MSIPLNIDWQQILLHLFNFAILAGGLYLLLYRPVKQFMEQREAYYQDLHQEAEQAKEQADRLKADYQAKLSAGGEEPSPSVRQMQSRSWSSSGPSRAGGRQAGGGGNPGQGPGRTPSGSRTEMIAKASKELVDMAVTAAEKIALGADGDPYEQFLTLAEREGSHDEQSQ